MIIGNKVILREKKLSDAQDDYNWETDHELAHLDAAPIVVTTFSQYLSDYTEELRYSLPNSHRFAIDTLDGKHIGNCSYYNISKFKGEAELGIMIGNRDYWDKGYGTDAVTTLVNHIFSQTRLKRIYLETLDTNSRAQKCFPKCGFTPCGRMSKDGYSFIVMEVYRDQWQKRQSET
jgi:RimJ/RimL family protein N-acetyltransferase